MGFGLGVWVITQGQSFERLVVLVIEDVALKEKTYR